LEKSLDEVNKKLKQNQSENKLSAAAVELLQKEQKLLETFLERQTAAFANSAVEIKENTKQLEMLAQAGLESSNAYRELFAATSELKDNASDLKAALMNAAPDDVAINAATDAARGLIGVYGLAQAATAILGEENEAFAETMVKLQAAETALQSIEAIRAVFKKEGAVLQAKELILTRASIIAKNIETATESKNVVVKYAAIAAQKVLNLTMAAAGGPIMILIGTLALLLVTMAAFASRTAGIIRSNKELADSYNDYADTIEKTREQIAKGDEIRIANLRKDFATAKQLRDQETADMINQYRLREKAAKDFEDKFGGAVNIERLITRQQKVVDKDDDDEDEKKKLDALIAARDNYNKDVQFLTDQETSIRVKQSEDIRANIEENIKAQQQEIDIYKTSLVTRSKVFEDLAGNEEKSYDDRIEAAKRFAAFQIELINQEARKQRLTPGQSPSELRTIESNRNAAIIEARRASNKQIETLVKEENERFRIAQLEILKIQLDDAAKAQEAIADNEKKGYNERLDAAYTAFVKRRAILIAEHDAEMKIAGRTPEEKLALEKKYASDINAITIAYGSKQLELLQINQEQQTAIIEKEQQKRRDAISRDSSSAVNGLNDQFSKGLVGITAYNKKREEIERNTRINLLKEEVNNATGRMMIAKEGSAERVEAEKDWRDATLAYSDEVLERQKADAQFLADTYKEAGLAALDAFKAVMLGSYDREKNAIEGQIEALERKKQKDIEVANASIQNEQDRAARITVIEARAQAEREILERRQKQIDFERARTQRAMDVGEIISKTALAVMHQLGSGDPYTATARAIAVGILGAAQLAKVLATPLPRFKKGKNIGKGSPNDEYEGLAVVGDGGKSELHVRPDGSMVKTPSTPTVTYVKKNDIIFPDADQALRDMASVSLKRMPGNVAPGQTNEAVIGSVNKIGKEIVQAVKGKKELQLKGSHAGMMAIHKYGQEYWKYIDQQVNF
jgi:hypothetical protein